MNYNLRNPQICYLIDYNQPGHNRYAAIGSQTTREIHAIRDYVIDHILSELLSRHIPALKRDQ